jgi:hypothetical protein
VSISVENCSWVKCNEVLQCSDNINNKVSNIIKKKIKKIKLLLICILVLSHSFVFFRFYFLSMYIRCTPV